MSRLAGRGLSLRPLSLLTSLAATCAAAVSLALPATAGAAPHMAGVQSHVLWANVSNDEMDRQLDAMKQLGVGITRVDVGWASIEPDAKGQHDPWYVGRLDHLVQGANARGIKLLLLFAETPCWASTAPDSLKQGCQGAWWDRDVQNYAPRHMSDYADALGWVVKRYGDQVYSYEIWNEPNQDYFFHTDDPVGDYAKMVRAAYPAAKAADPHPIVVAGSLSDSDFEFTDALFRHGVKGYFDAWSIHPYSDDRSPLNTNVDSPRYSFLSGVPAVRDVMRRYGDNKPIWLTEFGWSTCNVRGPVHWQNCVDQDTQATYLKSAFRQMAKWSYVPVGIWFNLKNTSSAPDDRVGNYGLMTQDGSHKPAFGAFQQIAQELQAGGTPSSPPSPPITPASLPPQGHRHHRAHHRRHAVVHVARVGGTIVITGTAPRGVLARLLVFRSAGSGFEQHASYRWAFGVGQDGHFRLRLHGREFSGGTWRIVVRPTGHAHWRKAAAVLGS
jgi:polysaccharide biosynthesis protein PslG